VVVPVPIFYSTYGPGYDYAYPSVADPQVDPSVDAESASEESEAPVATSEEALRFAYLQGARDALAQEKDKDSARTKPSPAKRDPFAPSAKNDPEPKAEADSAPATVFIFKDGRKIETKNFAIMGTTLYDMSGPTLRKVQLTGLDTEATMKANDGNGITIKLP
jgi:hypothetical protein